MCGHDRVIRRSGLLFLESYITAGRISGGGASAVFTSAAAVQRWSVIARKNKSHMHVCLPGRACHRKRSLKPTTCLRQTSPLLLAHTHARTQSYTQSHSRAHKERGRYGDHWLICLFIRLCLPLSRGGVGLKNVPRLGGWICMMNLEFIYLFSIRQHPARPPPPTATSPFPKSDFHTEGSSWFYYPLKGGVSDDNCGLWSAAHRQSKPKICFPSPSCFSGRDGPAACVWFVLRWQWP